YLTFYYNFNFVIYQSMWATSYPINYYFINYPVINVLEVRYKHDMIPIFFIEYKLVQLSLISCYSYIRTEDIKALASVATPSPSSCPRLIEEQLQERVAKEQAQDHIPPQFKIYFGFKFYR
ncbi:hypothetical protein ACJX0J_031471, partial [Zea mays]